MITVKRYKEEYKREWNIFCDQSPYSLFQFNRDFLEYNTSSIVDSSYILCGGNKIISVFPAAYHITDGKTIISHPRSSFGGLVYTRSRPSILIPACLDALFERLRSDGYTRCVIKNLPNIYSNYLNDELGFFLKSKGGVIINSKLSAVVSLKNEYQFSSQRLRIQKKLSSLITITDEEKYLEDFWVLLDCLLKDKYKSKPVHNYIEICALKNMFPNNVEFLFALLENKVVGGLVLFTSNRTVKAQYIASNEIGKQHNVVDMLFLSTFKKFKELDYSYIDLGTSNGTVNSALNAELFEYKFGFGAGGLEYFDYEFDKI